MRKYAGKMWISLALMLALSALFLPQAANAEGQPTDAFAVQHETAGSHDTSGPDPDLCHKVATCETPVIPQLWQKSFPSEVTGKLAVALKLSGLASVAPEAHLPPPKA